MLPCLRNSSDAFVVNPSGGSLSAPVKNTSTCYRVTCVPACVEIPPSVMLIILCR